MQACDILFVAGPERTPPLLIFLIKVSTHVYARYLSSVLNLYQFGYINFILLEIGQAANSDFFGNAIFKATRLWSYDELRAYFYYTNKLRDTITAHDLTALINASESSKAQLSKLLAEGFLDTLKAPNKSIAAQVLEWLYYYNIPVVIVVAFGVGLGFTFLVDSHHSNVVQPDFDDIQQDMQGLRRNNCVVAQRVSRIRRRLTRTQNELADTREQLDDVVEHSRKLMRPLLKSLSGFGRI